MKKRDEETRWLLTLLGYVVEEHHGALVDYEITDRGEGDGAGPWMEFTDDMRPLFGPIKSRGYHYISKEELTQEEAQELFAEFMDAYRHFPYEDPRINVRAKLTRLTRKKI